MRLLEVHLDGFGRLVNRSYRFAPGFNLIFGPNEAGKSTLQQAILAMLYGFFDRGRVSSAQKQVVNTIQPWDEAAPYSGSLIYELDDGQTFRASRAFAPSLSTSLATYPQGRDISSDFEDERQGRLLFADAQLGMSKQVFENTCYVRQAELIALETSADAITDTLMRLSSSASTDTTATDAVALLEETLKNQVGTERAYTKPLAKARRRLSELEKELGQALHSRRELLSQIVELNQCEQRLESLDLERKKLRYLRTLGERETLHQRQNGLDAVEAEIERVGAEAEKWSSWADFPIEVRDDVVRLTDQRDRLQQECANLGPRAAQARKQLEELRGQTDSLHTQVQDLSSAMDVPIGELAPLRHMVSSFDVAYARRQAADQRWSKGQLALEEMERVVDTERDSISELLDLGYAGLAKLHQRVEQSCRQERDAAEALHRAAEEWSSTGLSEDDFQQLKQAVEAFYAGAQTPQPRGCRSPFSRGSQAPQLPPPQVTQYDQIAPIHERWMQTRAELETAKAERAAAEREARQALGRFSEGTLDNDTFHQLEERIARYQQLQANVQQRRQDVADAKTEAERVRREYAPIAATLKAKLEALGLEVSDPHKALETFEAQCERRSSFERTQALLKEAQLKAQALSRDVQALADTQAALQQTKITLCETLAKAEIACPPDCIPDGLARFEEGIAGHRQWREAEAAHRAAISRRDTLLEEHSAEELSGALAAAEAELTEARSEHPEWTELRVTRSRQEYDPLIREAEQAWLSEHENCSRLSDAVQSAYTDRHPAEIAEDIAETKRTVRHLECYGDALELARRELETATHEFQKQFAPKVEQLMSEGLAQATEGRYSTVQVHPTSLSVSLVAPELGHAVRASQLSTGTRDLIYLMLRVAIARLMSHTGEKLPLLLDDPLVQCDRVRQQQTLEYLARLAEEAQVFLFTKDEWTRSWFEEHLQSLADHRLHVLP